LNPFTTRENTSDPSRGGALKGRKTDVDNGETQGRSPSGPWRGGNGPVLAICLTVLALTGCTGNSRSTDEQADQAATSLDPNASGPSLVFGATPSSVDQGGVTTLSWSATNADDCSASGGWSGSKTVSGSELIGPLSAGATYGMTCNGPGGSAIQMISVSVVGSVTLSWVAPAENVDGSQLDDLAGYKIYYGTESRSYSDMAEIGNPAVTSHTLRLVSGEYYLAMTALDRDGNESAYSNEVIRSLN